VQNGIFWLSGLLFFAVQVRTLGVLLRRNEANADTRTVEIVWTMVPASLIAALALMLGGLTSTSWTKPERGDEPLEVRLIPATEATAPASDAR